MTSIGMTSHYMTSCYGVHFCIACVERPVPKTCKFSIRYVAWFTRYSTTLIIFRMTLVHFVIVMKRQSVIYSGSALLYRIFIVNSMGY